jgi:hypothetical protein
MKWRDFGIMVIVGFAAIAMLSSNTQVSADNTTYYVDFTDGSDAANGTSPATAWKTIAKVNGETFLPGDQILFQRGETWAAESLIMPSSGSALNPITIGAYGEGANPLFDGNDNTVSGGDGVSLSSQSHIIVQDLTIREYNQGILTSGNTNITIRRVTISDCAGNGISVSTGDDTIIERVQIYDISAGPGVAVDSSNDVLINYSIIRNSQSGVSFSGTSADAKVQNTVIYANTGDGVTLADAATTMEATNVIAANNGGFGFITDNLDLTITTSISYNNTGGAYNGTYTDGGGNLTTNPQFVNAPTFDFRLTLTSPAVNTGTNLSLTTDYAGTSVPQGSTPDIGAFEFAAPNAAASLTQFKSDGTTSLAIGAWTNESTVVLKFNMASANPTDSLTPQVEFQQVGTTFNNAFTHASSVVAYSGTPVQATITITGLSNFASYHWQARVVNAAGNGAWTSFGGNAESAADVRVDTTAPTTTSAGTDANWHSANVTVTLTCSDLGSGCANTYYTTNGTTPTTASTAGTSVVLGNEGTFTIKYFSVDSALNSEAVKTAANTVKIDKTKPTGSVLINSGATSTTSRSVSLKLASTDSGGSGNHQVQVSDKSDFAGATWQEYTTTLSYSFTNVPAVKTIYAQFKDAAGNASEVYSDTITYVGDEEASDVTDDEDAEDVIDPDGEVSDSSNTISLVVAALAVTGAALIAIVGTGMFVIKKRSVSSTPPPPLTPPAPQTLG